MYVNGWTGSAGPRFIAFFTAVATFFQSVKVASGSSRRTRSTFSASPPAKTIGMYRVDLLFRNTIATSRPWEGSRSRSINTAAGDLLRKWPIRPDISRGDASTVIPASRRTRARSRARSRFQLTRRIDAMSRTYQNRNRVTGRYRNVSRNDVGAPRVLAELTKVPLL